MRNISVGIIARNEVEGEPFDSLDSLKVFDLSIGLEIFEGINWIVKK